HDQHCHPVPCETIKADRLGLSRNGVIFTPEMIKDSLDEQCHVCVDTVGKFRYPYCVFVPKQRRHSDCATPCWKESLRDQCRKRKSPKRDGGGPSGWGLCPRRDSAAG